MDAAENARLSLVGPGTPCGELMRRYWIPVGISAELQLLPRRVRILGEDLVLFRDGHGRVGLLGLHCAHRGTSLEYGQLEPDGIRCHYHGWLYDAEGLVLDMPAEPPESTFKLRVRQPAYPCRELAGLVFAYMGPPERMPELPHYDFLVRADATRDIYSREIDCSWLQSLENQVDPVHTAILHRIPGENQFPDRWADMPVFETETTAYGMTVTHIRSRWRTVHRIFLPILQIISGELMAPDEEPPPGDVVCSNQATWRVPIDDTHHLRLMVDCTPLDKDGNAPPHRAGGGQGDTRSYEAVQREPGDLQAQVSQGAVASREEWRLASSDRGVVVLQEILRQAIDTVARGEDPPGVIRDPAQARYVETWPIIRFEEADIDPWRVGDWVWSQRLLGPRGTPSTLRPR